METTTSAPAMPGATAAMHALSGRHRRIIICCDGTWNTPDQKDGKSFVPTNVVQLARSLPPIAPDGTSQLVYYQEGVGTFNWTDKLTGGAFGTGLMKNVERAYRFLVDNYRTGDEIYLFGFSRGAFTARSLAGLIRNCGIVYKNDGALIRKAIEIYRSGHPNDHPNSQQVREFIHENCHREHFRRDFLIKFVGVWDTVGALGVPLVFSGPLNKILATLVNRRYLFHDVRLSSKIEYAYQALAVNEERRAFAPSVWEVDTVAELMAKFPGKRHQTVEQRWFVGVHSNVGGGYDPCGLSNITLRWMIDRAEASGLAFDQELVDKFTHDATNCVLRQSRKSFYRLVPRYYRPIGTTSPHTEVLDDSVRTWAAGLSSEEKRLPKNLDTYLQTHGTEVPEGGRRILHREAV